MQGSRRIIKRIFKNGIAVLMIFIISSCQYFNLYDYSEWKEKTNNSSVDIYCAGNYYYYPCYWKNDERFDLQYVYATANNQVVSIALEGEDIYCGGTYSTGTIGNACYWKNGSLVKVELDNESNNSIINSLAGSSGMIFSCGYEDNGSADMPCFWINKKKYPLSIPNGAVEGQANSISVDSETDNFYICGQYNDSTYSYACYWKNGGSCITLSSIAGTHNSAYAVKVLNGSVYIGGYSYNASGETVPCYWKDGNRVDLSYTTSGIVYGIEIYNGSLYLTGVNNISAYAALWKGNSVAWSDTSSSRGIGITLFDDDIYICGLTNSAFPCYWKNGSITTLPYSVSGCANSIAVKRR